MVNIQVNLAFLDDRVSVTMNLKDPTPSAPDQVVSTVNKVIMKDLHEMWYKDLQSPQELPL